MLSGVLFYAWRKAAAADVLISLSISSKTVVVSPYVAATFLLPCLILRLPPDSRFWVDLSAVDDLELFGFVLMTRLRFFGLLSLLAEIIG